MFVFLLDTAVSNVRKNTFREFMHFILLFTVAFNFVLSFGGEVKMRKNDRIKER